MQYSNLYLYCHNSEIPTALHNWKIKKWYKSDDDIYNNQQIANIWNIVKQTQSLCTLYQLRENTIPKAIKKVHFTPND